MSRSAHTVRRAHMRHALLPLGTLRKYRAAESQRTRAERCAKTCGRCGQAAHGKCPCFGCFIDRANHALGYRSAGPNGLLSTYVGDFVLLARVATPAMHTCGKGA